MQRYPTPVIWIAIEAEHGRGKINHFILQLELSRRLEYKLVIQIKNHNHVKFLSTLASVTGFFSRHSSNKKKL